MEEKNTNATKRRNPVTWVPSVYFAMGLPFVVLNMVTVLMFKGLDISDAQIALWTSVIMLPWTLKPLWSPFLEMYRTKKFFVVLTQLLSGCLFGLVALALNLPSFFALSIALLGIIALSGATHDVATDGVYMKELSPEDQAKYIGWQGAFYNLAKIVATGGLVYLAGYMMQYFTGAVLSVLLGLIVIGGIKRIAQVTEKLVPFMAVVYLLGAFSILAYNYQHILPSFISVFSNIFSGTAATGGFLGATVVWAFNRGVNRGLFSNEAGQGSAPIAHAAAKTEEPVSEGMVALLEPFIDTIVICSITGLVLLSSGTWLKKFENKFQQADTVVLSGAYHESDPDGKSAVSEHVLGNKPLPFYTGSLEVRNGQILNTDITLLHARSFADSVRVKEGKEVLFSGTLSVRDGRIELPMNKERAVYLTGKSLLHSAPLSTEAFKKGFLGDWGQFIIPFSLLLFAFSTTIAWSYYGDRAVTYLWGTKYVRIYHVIYIVGFFLASFTDTTIVWTLSGITVALMTLPNLIGILLLHKEVKSSVNEYWRRMKEKL